MFDLFEFAAEHHPGVVDQHADRAALFVQLVAETGDGGDLAHVQGVGVGVAAGVTDALHHLAGGGDALPGENWVERGDGSHEDLSATDSADMQPGDSFVILTPGGGGYGETNG